MGEDGNLSLASEWQAHELEAWSAAFSRSDENIVFSGADDACFKAWDLRDTGQ